MWNLRTNVLFLVAASSTLCAGIQILPEHQRPDPFGGIVEADRTGEASPVKLLKVARGGYASFHVATDAMDIDAKSKLTVDVYREWFHRNKDDGKYYPDALIPATRRLGDNKVPGQKVRAFWVDVWVPSTQKAGRYPLRISAGRSVATLTIQVLPSTIPAGDVLTLDHNSYGTSWMFRQYPQTLPKDDEAALIRLIHAYHRVFYEHRGDFHQLGYGHGGKVGPEFAPQLEGTGRGKHIANWDRYDRHFGPLLDGSAFRDTRRGSKPIPYVYLPITPEWPASFLWWGEPGYEVEFTKVVGEMEKHFREKGWTSTYFELFFNHKKRYKAFSWDGDEVRFARDNDWVIAFRKMFDKAVPADTPVKFVTRSDTSWSMEDQFDRLKGVVNFWVAGEGMLSWYPGAVAKLKDRGDQVWSYGGTPAVTRPLATIALNPVRSWINGTQGFVRWQTVDPGDDPWFSLNGGGETLVYPGDRFGEATPLASIRLKVQRNVMQDLALADAKAKSSTAARDSLISALTQRFNNTRPEDWQNTRPAMASTPVLDWNNVSIDETLAPFEKRFANIDGASWARVRELLQ